MTWSWARSPNGTSDWTPIGGETADSYTPIYRGYGPLPAGHCLLHRWRRAGQERPGGLRQRGGGGAGQERTGAQGVPERDAQHLRGTRPPGRDIGAALSATDADNDALTYSLGGPDRATFDLDTSSGQLRTKGVLTGFRRTSYTVFVSVSDGKDDAGMPEASPQIDATTEVTINVTTPRRSGGGGGGGGFGGPILTVTTAVAGEAPAGLSFGFAYTCANTRGELLSTRTFTVAAGRTFGLLIAAGLSCSLDGHRRRRRDRGGRPLHGRRHPAGGLQDDGDLHLRARPDGRGPGMRRRSSRRPASRSRSPRAPATPPTRCCWRPIARAARPPWTSRANPSPATR